MGGVVKQSDVDAASMGFKSNERLGSPWLKALTDKASESRQHDNERGGQFHGDHP
jgi:hypothetical protein